MSFLPIRAGVLPLALRIQDAMPWVVGQESLWRVADVDPATLVISDLWDGPTLYLGYLLEGFNESLPGRFDPQRVSLALRAGWNAVAVTARTEHPALAGALGPFLAPTAPRPHPAAPLGFTLFACAWLRERLGVGADEKLSSLRWAQRLNALIGPRSPVFCDPILELNLLCRTPDEDQFCSYSPAKSWSTMLRALTALAPERQGG